MGLFDIFREKSAETDRSLEELPVSRIIPNPSQPRRTFDEESIAELARSIEQVGLIQPLVVRKSGQFYELVSGERRLRAIKRLGLKRALCIVDKRADEVESALMAIVENLQREDLNFFEEAECYGTLIAELGFTQEELAERIGKSQSFIANKLRLLKLEPQVREAIGRRGLTERHARAVLRLRSLEDRLALVSKIGAAGLSVSEAEKLAESQLDDMYDKRRGGVKPRPVIVRLVKDYRIFLNTINNACDQLRSGGIAVDVEQTDTPDGVDILIRVSRMRPGAGKTTQSN